MDYGEVLSKAWRIIWKFKILWIFGILASCGRSAGSGGNSGFRFQGNPPFRQQFNFPPGQFPNFLTNVPNWIWILLALLILGLIVVAIVLNAIGRAGLVHGVNLADDGAPALPFGSLFSSSMHYFWRILGLNLLIGLVVLIVVLVIIAGSVGLGFAAQNTPGVAFLFICLIPIICVLVLVGLVLSVWIEQSNIAIVTEDVGIFSALGRGWEVVTKNIGPFILLTIILALIGLVVGFIFAIPLIFIFIPLILGFASGVERVAGGSAIVSGLLFLIYLPILIILSGILQSYVTSVWTLTYRRLTGRGPHASAEG